jgi:KDO2-lipid IV(A) lauroyltransferase
MMMFWYKIFYGFCRLLALLPLRCLYVISDFLFVVLCYAVRYRRRVVMENLRNSFPEKSERELWSIARRFYRFLCDLFIEALKVANIDMPQMRRRIHYSNPEMLEELRRKGKQILFITGHYGNWEWLATLENSISYHHATLYQPLNNKLFDRFVYDLRTKHGTDAIPSNMAIRAINQYRQENRLTTLCFLSDQSPTRDAIHYWTTFLNQDTPVYTGVEKLAKRYSAAVLYYEVRRVKRGYYEVDTTLITENAAETAEMEITEKHVRLLEETVRRNPQYWLWSHRRWKHKRVKSETINQTVPIVPLIPVVPPRSSEFTGPNPRSSAFAMPTPIVPLVPIVP